MKHEVCGTYQDALFAAVEGLGLAEGPAALDQHLHECVACAAELDALQGLRENLLTLGQQYAATAPQVSLVEIVMLGVEPVRQAQLIAYLDGELDEVERAGLAKRLMLHADLRAELEGMKQVDMALREAAALEPVPGPVELVTPVMQTLPASSTVERLEDYRAHRQLEAALYALGEDTAAALPKVDLVDQVMSSITPAERVVFVPLKTRPKTAVELRAPRQGRGMRWAAWAAAAGVCLTAGWLVFRAQPVPEDPGIDQMAFVQEFQEGTALRDPLAVQTAVPRGPQRPGVRRPVEPEVPAEVRAHEPRRARYESPTLQSVLNAQRRAMMNNAEALLSLAEWAQLSEEEARALLETLDWTTDAVLGAAQFLPPEEAVAVLQAAIAANPEDPYLRYALARNLQELDQLDAGREQLAAWSQLDPENGLPQYMDANLLFQQGRAEEALAMLSAANAQNLASVYTSESALHHRDALIGNGMDPEVASLIAASYAGTNEYASLVSLSEQLLAYGKQYQALGDFASAEAIYLAVQQMGVQLDQNAIYANVRLAGTDVQMDAVNALMGLYQIFETPEARYLLQTAYTGLTHSLGEITNVFTDYAQLFAELTEDQIYALTQQILREGDASVYPNYFPSQRP